MIKCFKNIVKFLIPKRILKLLRKIFFQRSFKDNHNLYGIIYLPYYNLQTPLNSRFPDIYNQYGNKIDLYFIRDIHSAHLVYSNSKYFQFDRYNFGLDTHFYTHDSMLETMGKPKKRYGMLIEAEVITPNDYKIFNKHRGLENNFDLIFTYSFDILNKIPNSRYVPYYFRPWYGYSNVMSSTYEFNKNQDILSLDNYKNKNKNISIIASGKEMVPLHRYRNEIAMKCKNNNLADLYGTINGGKYCDISEPFKDYRFSIVIENEITPYGFTEKITNCFAAMTIPIYFGATKISNIFNPDGIIQFDNYSDIDGLLKKCTKELYEERIPAIVENYKIININKTANDIIYEKYINNDIGKVNPEELFKLL